MQTRKLKAGLSLY